MIKRVLLTLSLVATLSGIVAFATPALAVDPLDNACKGAAAKAAVCEEDKQETISGKGGVLYRITQLISAIAGVAAVIAMIVGGFMYVLSSGDSAKAATARNTLIYAAVGLVVIVLAQSIISFVVNRL
jgi:hypothetical protein